MLLTHCTPVSRWRSRPPVGLGFELIAGALWHGVNEGTFTLAYGSSSLTVNGRSSAPFQCVLAGMLPTAAIGVACTCEEPVAMAAFTDVEFVIIPQPRFRVELPVAVMPVAPVGMRLTTQ
jgi:hypothetical protein